jgi:hypothetical protein
MLKRAALSSRCLKMAVTHSGALFIFATQAVLIPEVVFHLFSQLCTDQISSSSISRLQLKLYDCMYRELKVCEPPSMSVVCSTTVSSSSLRGFLARLCIWLLDTPG